MNIKEKKSVIDHIVVNPSSLTGIFPGFLCHFHIFCCHWNCI